MEKNWNKMQLKNNGQQRLHVSRSRFVCIFYCWEWDKTRHPAAASSEENWRWLCSHNGNGSSWGGLSTVIGTFLLSFKYRFFILSDNYKQKSTYLHCWSKSQWRISQKPLWLGRADPVIILIIYCFLLLLQHSEQSSADFGCQFPVS